jgi:hypothetical protein
MASMAGPVPLREHLPWMHGVVNTAHLSTAPRLAEALGSLGFEVVRLEGERIVNDRSLFEQLFGVLGFPEDCPRDWEGFRSRAGEVAGRLPEHSAILWLRADASAFFSLRTVAEAVHFLLGWGDALAETGRQLEIVLLGQTRDYPQPEAREAFVVRP